MHIWYYTTTFKMSAFEMSTFKPKMKMSGCVLNISKKQDDIFYGYNNSIPGNEFEWGVLLDGHGTDHFINKMRTQDWGKIMSEVDPWAALEIILLEISGTYGYNSGSTLLIMRCYVDRIETISIGDSEIIIHKNGKMIYKSTPHNTQNESEMVRLSNMPIGKYYYLKQKTPIPQIRTSDTIQARIGGYFYFENDSSSITTQIAMSQAIGHNNVTCYEPERHIEFFTQEDSIQCIMGSDGLFEMLLIPENILKVPVISDEELLEIVSEDTVDMLTMNAEELCEKAENRWKQEWKYLWHPNDPTKEIDTNFGDGWDDISAIVFRKS
jgi:serine/threonine protein phosphatase PrpC